MACGVGQAGKGGGAWECRNLENWECHDRRSCGWLERVGDGAGGDVLEGTYHVQLIQQILADRLLGLVDGETSGRCCQAIGVVVLRGDHQERQGTCRKGTRNEKAPNENARDKGRYGQKEGSNDYVTFSQKTHLRSGLYICFFLSTQVKEMRKLNAVESLLLKPAKITG